MAEPIRGVSEEGYAVSVVVVMGCVQQVVWCSPRQAIPRHPADAGCRTAACRMQKMMLSKPASPPRAPTEPPFY